MILTYFFGFWFRSLIPALQENGKYKEAADLVKHTQNDMPVCIKLLCEGKHYQDAIFESKTLAEPLGKCCLISKMFYQT